MKVIGLTGGIGSGKSTVTLFLAELGAVIIDTDKLGHETFQPGSEVWQQVANEFGKQIISTDGTIDRKKLGEMVFARPEARARLEEIVHPAIYNIVKLRLKEYEKQKTKLAVLEVPLLVEAGWESLVDEVWVTTAPQATILKRMKQNKGMAEEETLARIQSQLSSEERVKHADIIIDTNCTLDELKARVKEQWQRLQI